MTLSPVAQRIWGKTDDLWGKYRHRGWWLPLYAHLLDAGYVAGKLYDHLPELSRAALDAGAPDAAAARQRFIAICGLHDIGKATPEFLSTGNDGDTSFEKTRLVSELITFPKIVTRGRHEDATFFILQKLYGDRVRSCAFIAGAHHGFMPSSQMSTNGDFTADDEMPEEGSSAWSNFGWNNGWGDVQREIAEYVLSTLGVSSEALALPVPHYVSSAYIGLVMLVDRIASEAPFFPLWKDSASWTTSRAEGGWKKMSLHTMWGVPEADVSVDDLYALRFPETFPKHDAYPMQRAVVEASRSVSQPSLIVVESGMGSGKTEAGILSAETMCSRFGGSGMSFAMPTMSTADSALKRISGWAEQTNSDVVMHLGHGRAELSERYRSFLQSDEKVRASKTLFRKGMGLLATASASTVDQVAKMALRGYSSYPTSGMLSGKAVVFDEVHTYDEYTMLYVLRSIERLASAGSPVIILSATLNQARRERIIESYAQGALVRSGSQSKPSPVPAPPRAYPLITVLDPGNDVEYIVPEGGSGEPEKTIHLHVHEDDSDDLIIDLIRRRTPNGGCVGIIRSTVANAQGTYEAVSRSFGEDNVCLIHSRFTSQHRDEAITSIEGVVGRGKKRPDPGEWHITVSTQVIEQSLDFDFDYMISDIAPLDLILQRIGREWRHVENNDSRPVAETHFDVIGSLVREQDFRVSMPTIDSKAGFIYSHYQLHVAGEFLRETPTIRTPVDIPSATARMIEPLADEDPSVVRAHAIWKAQQKNSEKRAISFAIETSREAGHEGEHEPLSDALCNWKNTDAGTKSTIRDADGSVEGLLLTKKEDGWYTPDGQGPLRGDTPEESLSLGRCTIRLPFIRDYYGDDLASPDEWRGNEILRGRKVILLRKGRVSVGGREFTYDRLTGLKAIRGGELDG